MARQKRTNDAQAGREVDPSPRERPEIAAQDRSDDGEAFMRDPEDGPAVIGDDLAETLAEEFVRSATRGGDGDEPLDEFVTEEIGGPFVETTAGEEFASGVDDSNPEDATSEPLPRAVGPLAQRPRDEE